MALLVSPSHVLLGWRKLCSTSQGCNNFLLNHETEFVAVFESIHSNLSKQLRRGEAKDLKDKEFQDCKHELDNVIAMYRIVRNLCSVPASALFVLFGRNASNQQASNAQGKTVMECMVALIDTVFPLLMRLVDDNNIDTSFVTCCDVIRSACQVFCNLGLQYYPDSDSGSKDNTRNREVHGHLWHALLPHFDAWVSVDMLATLLPTAAKAADKVGDVDVLKGNKLFLRNVSRVLDPILAYFSMFVENPTYLDLILSSDQSNCNVLGMASSPLSSPNEEKAVNIDGSTSGNLIVSRIFYNLFMIDREYFNSFYGGDTTAANDSKQDGGETDTDSDSDSDTDNEDNANDNGDGKGRGAARHELDFDDHRSEDHASWRKDKRNACLSESQQELLSIDTSAAYSSGGLAVSGTNTQVSEAKTDEKQDDAAIANAQRLVAAEVAPATGVQAVMKSKAKWNVSGPSAEAQTGKAQSTAGASEYEHAKWLHKVIPYFLEMNGLLCVLLNDNENGKDKDSGSKPWYFDGERGTELAIFLDMLCRLTEDILIETNHKFDNVTVKTKTEVGEYHHHFEFVRNIMQTVIELVKILRPLLDADGTLKAMKQKVLRSQDTEDIAAYISLCNLTFDIVSNVSLIMIDDESFLSKLSNVWIEASIKACVNLNVLVYGPRGNNNKRDNNKLSQINKEFESNQLFKDLVTLRRYLVCVLCNLSCENNIDGKNNEYIQNLIRAKGGVELLLNSTKIDHYTLFLQQWAIMVIRNITQNNIENQKYIYQIQNVQKIIPNKELDKMGFELVFNELSGKVTIDKIDPAKKKPGSTETKQL